MSRERAIVARVSRLGAVSVEQIGRQFGVSRSLAAEQVRRRLESIPRAWRRAGDREVAAIPRLALTPSEAAAALGMGLTSFKKYVQPQLRIVRRGKLRVIPVSELERWADENAKMVLGGDHQRRFADPERL